MVKEKLGEVDENNKIIIPKRLRPTDEVRMIKITDSIRKSKNIPKDRWNIGKTKSGTLVKSRRLRRNLGSNLSSNLKQEEEEKRNSAPRQQLL